MRLPPWNSLFTECRLFFVRRLHESETGDQLYQHFTLFSVVLCPHTLFVTDLNGVRVSKVVYRDKGSPDSKRECFAIFNEHYGRWLFRTLVTVDWKSKCTWRVLLSRSSTLNCSKFGSIFHFRKKNYRARENTEQPRRNTVREFLPWESFTLNGSRSSLKIWLR